MSHRSDINEGLTRHSLDNLVMPMLSIDEYESKISDKRAIVIGFFVEEEGPANDLSNFIDRSSHPILDTEVSPAPTPEGYYMVFVEMQRDENFPRVVMEILGDVENLCKIDGWTFQCPKQPEPIDLSEKAMRDNIILDQDDILELPEDPEPEPVDEVPEPDDADEEDAVKESMDFWRSAAVDTIMMEGNELVLSSRGSEHRYRIVESIPDDLVMIPDDSFARQVQAVLGSAYAVFATNAGIMVEDGEQQRFIANIA